MPVMRALIYVPLISCIASCSVAKHDLPKKVNIRVTAYHAKESDHLKYKNLNAIGTVLKKGWSIAADWSRLPLGTKIKFNNNIYEVCDFGSALIKPINQIPTVDLYVANNREMRNWGTRFFNDVEIVEWGSFERSAEILKHRLKYAHCREMYNRIQQKL